MTVTPLVLLYEFFTKIVNEVTFFKMTVTLRQKMAKEQTLTQIDSDSSIERRRKVDTNLAK